MAPSGELTSGCSLPSGDLVALHPGAEVAFGHLVFIGAGAHAVAAADALIDIDDHAPPVLADVVGRERGRWRADGSGAAAPGGRPPREEPRMSSLPASRRAWRRVVSMVGSSEFGAVRLVAALAGFVAGVLLGNHLFEPGRLSGIRFVAAHAQWPRFRLNGLHRRGISNVCGQRAMASFARDTLVSPFVVYRQFVGMTIPADTVTGVVDWLEAYLVQHRSPIVPESTEAGWHHDLPNEKEKDKTGCKDQGRANQVSSIVPTALQKSPFPSASAALPANESQTGTEPNTLAPSPPTLRRGATKILDQCVSVNYQDIKVLFSGLSMFIVGYFSRGVEKPRCPQVSERRKSAFLLRIRAYLGSLGAAAATEQNHGPKSHCEESARNSYKNVSHRSVLPPLSSVVAANCAIRLKPYIASSIGMSSLTIFMTTGPRVTTKSAGRMKKKIGKTSLTASFAAFSSALCRVITRM